MQKSFWLIVYACFWTFVSEAQLQHLNVPFQRSNGSDFVFALAGGLNNPQFSQIDLNNDGKKDLIVFDRVGNVLLPFINNGTANTVDYSYAPQYRAFFPKGLQRFVLLRDYNCDGLEDIFTYNQSMITGATGIAVYKASRDVNGNLVFQLAKDILKFNRINQTTTFNVYISTIDIPAIDDIDGDGDLDILTFNPGGGYVELFTNRSKERGWNCDSLNFEFVDNCWGRFYESGISQALNLSPRVDSCAAWSNWTPLRPANQLHAGSTLLTLDMNNDGKKELLLGDLSFGNLNLLTNTGTASIAHITQQEVNFPQNSTPVALDLFPAAFYLDVNNDGKKDLIAAPNIDDISLNDRCAWLYTNSQSNATPVFNFQKQDFLVGDMIDVGGTAAPTFVDYNGDGLLDIVVGNYGIFMSPSIFRTRLISFLNIGTATNPIFKLDQLDFASLQQYNFRRLVPNFGDIDNDGDLDMILGLEDGTLLIVSNTGNSTTPSFATPIPNYFNIDVGQHSVPQWIDLDQDGDLDLVIGERNGNVNYHENRGTASAAIYTDTAQTISLGFVDARIPGNLEGNSAPFIYNNQGTYQLFLGSETGNVWVYDSLQNNLLGNFRRLNTSHDSIAEGRQSILAVADINNDGQPDVLVGNKRGGLSLFTAPIPTAVPSIEMNSTDFELKIYPNPANSGIFVAALDVLAKTEIRVTNLLGHCLYAQNLSSFDAPLYIETQSWPSGIYCLQVLVGKQQKTYRILIAH